MRLLIVEDETALAEALTEILKQNGYLADAVANGAEALEYIRTQIYDLILLDIMLPGMDGLSILRQIRQEKIFTPVILLTAKAEVDDIVAGLDAGSDDYLPKPFSTAELLARVRALSRRGQQYRENALSCDDLSLQKSTMELCCGENAIRLGQKEYQLMELFLRNPRQVLPKELLLTKIWGLDTDTDYNNVEVYISFLRQKLHALGTRVSIKTSRGVGYSLEITKGDSL
ncbi:MAG: response regulator transcription factor [Eubacteriales bacterium]|nr:response regulator transcription factor [Eubacteriales bacterium]